MRADREIFINSIQDYDRDSLFSLSVSLFEELSDIRLRQKENERIYTEVYIQFCQFKEKYDSVFSEKEELKILLAKEIDKNSLSAKSTFGRKTEKLLPLIEEADNRTDEPVDESCIEESDTGVHRSRTVPFHENKPDNRKSGAAADGKRRNSLAASLAALPQQVLYDIDVEGLDEKYGQYNWRIAFWHSHQTLEKLPTPYYVKKVYTPIISSGLEHELTTIPYLNPLSYKSVVSPSVMADLLYRKFVLGLPFYRQATDFMMQGILLSRQTIINWAGRLVPEVLGVVYDFMTDCLIKYRYIQSDETYIQVNKDGRGPGHKSFMWMHCSSELSGCDPIIIFCYEQTRNTYGTCSGNFWVISHAMPISHIRSWNRKAAGRSSVQAVSCTAGVI